ncbi:OmpW/AlkL family protein [Microbulbifer variabilis]|uniref:Outer membrane beta-barrel protein n=1 Tax=Microbulbifer variabilis TaxID=266805 RepID=A0ABY4VAJ2_9GAMM|nr:OmpW family outer membrane protein [Microbulbifer variabilis]USD20960.1 outer membrane beta-barrel protein [Microbulbifer variabilis]
MNRITACATAALTAVLSAPVLAYEEGSFILRGGMATVAPDTSSSALYVGGAKQDGTGVDVDDGSALGLTGVYMFRDHWGLELVAATPFTHEIQAEGLGETFELGETKHLPPTLLVQWYPMDTQSAIQPYIGLGVNYTAFFDEEISSTANAVFETLGATDDAKLSLDNSFGLAAEAGIDFAFGADQRWLFNMSVFWMDIDTDATVKVPGVGNVTAKVDIDPLVYMAGLGYRF